MSGWITMGNLQVVTHLSREEIILALRELLQAGRLESIPGNGFANNRYRLMAGKAGTPIPAPVRVPPAVQPPPPPAPAPLPPVPTPVAAPMSV